ncbi:MBL fold metallo-hydrolase [Nocardioides sp. R-C-SC26]|uniref:MBL fold metallo-hydrolase n=1 Tax=Nocardioides sp. R-C-SC26 TaxID=2870414 RepID=UPI001E350827|nr:MBL fold metallo-hydrolase [Nocardioides sp. R-C-SC26]
MPFVEVADRVFAARYPWFDVNVGVVAGSRGLVLIDTHASAEAARTVLDDVRALGLGAVVEVVNTHAHLDHCLGNATMREEFGPVPIRAHEAAAAAIAEMDPASLDPGETDHGRAHPRWPEVARSTVTAPDTTFSSAAVIDLDDRHVELVHPGRAHTDGDAVVFVPDADVIFAGDLVEESGPPDFGPDSHPLEWPLALDVVLGLTTSATTVVPGHGAVVDTEFMRDQRAEIGVFAEIVRDLAGRGVPVDGALATPGVEWPWPADHLQHAVRRIYETLPRSQKRLPLL